MRNLIGEIKNEILKKEEDSECFQSPELRGEGKKKSKNRQIAILGFQCVTKT
jgi:hypothetical protein